MQRETPPKPARARAAFVEPQTPSMDMGATMSFIEPQAESFASFSFVEPQEACDEFVEPQDFASGSSTVRRMMAIEQVAAFSAFLMSTWGIGGVGDDVLMEPVKLLRSFAFIQSLSPPSSSLSRLECLPRSVSVIASISELERDLAALKSQASSLPSPFQMRLEHSLRELKRLPSASLAVNVEEADLSAPSSSSSLKDFVESPMAFSIFISSTFEDMKVERNLLMERVLPALRRRFGGVEICAVDFRWGISAASDALRFCLDAVSRSSLFLCLLGSRYGWHRTNEDFVWNDGFRKAAITHDFIKRFPNASITELEYRAFFNQQGEEKELSPAQRSLFLLKEISSCSSERLERLRDEVMQFNCESYAETSSSARNERFVSMCIEKLCDLLVSNGARRTASSISPSASLSSPASALAALRRSHWSYAQSLARESSYVRDPVLFSRFSSLLSSSSSSSLLLQGREPGSGVSTALSLFANMAVKDAFPGTKIIFHSLRVSGGSVASLISHLCLELLPSTISASSTSLSTEKLAALFSSSARPVLLIIDDVDLIREEEALFWLPSRDNVSVVLGAHSSSVLEQRHHQSRFSVYELRPLPSPLSYIERRLAAAGKHLTSEMILRLQRAIGRLGNARFSALISEFLIAHSVHESVNQKIDSLVSCQNANELILSAIGSEKLKTLLMFIDCAGRLPETHARQLMDLDSIQFSALLSEASFLLVPSAASSMLLLRQQLPPAVGSKSERMQCRLKLFTLYSKLVSSSTEPLDTFELLQPLRQFLELITADPASALSHLADSSSSLLTWNSMEQYFTSSCAFETKRLLSMLFKALRDTGTASTFVKSIASALGGKNASSSRAACEFSKFLAIDMGFHDAGMSLLKGDSNDTVLLTQGMIVIEMGQFQRALAMLSQIDLRSREVCAARGKVLRKLGQYSDAAVDLDCAFRLATVEQQSKIQWEQALVKQDLGDYDGARELFSEAFRSLHRQLGDSPTCARLAKDCGDLEILADRHQDARTWLERGLTMVAAGDPHHGDITCSLALLAQSEGKYSESRVLFDNGMALMLQSWSELNPLYLEALDGLCSLHLRRKHWAEAKRDLDRLLRLRRQVFGQNAVHPDIASTLASIGSLKQRQGNAAQALSHLRQSERMFREAYGVDDHQDIAASYINQSACLANQGDLAEAFALNDKAVRMLVKLLGSTHAFTAAALSDMGGLLARAATSTGGKQGATSKDAFISAAENCYGASLAVYGTMHSVEHPTVGQVLLNAALLEENRNKHAAVRLLSLAEKSMAENDLIKSKLKELH